MEIASSIECEQVMQMSLLAMTGVVFWVVRSLRGVYCESGVEGEFDAAILLDRSKSNHGDRFPHRCFKSAT